MTEPDTPDAEPRPAELTPDQAPPTPEQPATMGPEDPRPAIRRQALSIAVAVIPFGVAFGVLARQAGLSALDAAGFSALVFTGSAQFAAVSVLGDGGTVAAAVVPALLLNLRSLAFGLVMAPALRGSLPFRMVASQLMIDETTAVATGQAEHRWQRYGFLATGIILFTVWNLSTLAGATLLGDADELIETLGIDATIPAAFLALVWPRLADPTQRLVAAVGVVIAVVGAPVLPAGVPVILAAGAVVVARPWRSPAGPRSDETGTESEGTP